MVLRESIIEQPWWFFWDTATIIFGIFFQFLFQRQFKKILLYLLSRKFPKNTHIHRQSLLNIYKYQKYILQNIHTN